MASTRKAMVEAYVEGFRRSDHAAILACLTDDVRWDLPGFRHLEGKTAFDGEIENEAFTGRPTLVVDRLIEEGDSVVAVGEGQATLSDGNGFAFAFCDVFTFADGATGADGGLIRRVESYLVPLGGEGEGEG